MAEDALIKWMLVAVLAGFVVITALTWRGFQRYRRTMDDLENRLAQVQSNFASAAKDTGELDGLRRGQVSSSEFESAMAGLMAKVLRKTGKTVVKTRG